MAIFTAFVWTLFLFDVFTVGAFFPVDIITLDVFPFMDILSVDVLTVDVFSFYRSPLWAALGRDNQKIIGKYHSRPTDMIT